MNCVDIWNFEYKFNYIDIRIYTQNTNSSKVLALRWKCPNPKEFCEEQHLVDTLQNLLGLSATCFYIVMPKYEAPLTDMIYFSTEKLPINILVSHLLICFVRVFNLSSQLKLWMTENETETLNLNLKFSTDVRSYWLIFFLNTIYYVFSNGLQLFVWPFQTAFISVFG